MTIHEALESTINAIAVKRPDDAARLRRCADMVLGGGAAETRSAQCGGMGLFLTVRSETEVHVTVFDSGNSFALEAGLPDWTVTRGAASNTEHGLLVSLIGFDVFSSFMEKVGRLKIPAGGVLEALMAGFVVAPDGAPSQQKVMKIIHNGRRRRGCTRKRR